mmetsp:Transcript_71315/g.170359  ORF Transcript_71315/g.170359 Transcript_71315/m.170359 type:complete len:359 (-) Transcript_71315:63-1139(-)
MLVIYPVLPAVVPQGAVLLHVARVLRGLVEQRRRGKRLALDPEVLLLVTPLPVGPKAVHEAAVLGVPGQVPGAIEQLLRSAHHPKLRAVAMDVEEVLGPLDLVARLEAPGPVDVGGVVLVVLPVNFKVHGVVLPHEAPAFLRQPLGKGLRKHLRTVQVARLLGRLIGGDQRLAHVHVGVLTPVAVVHNPFRADGVQVRALPRQPELLLEHLEDPRHLGVILGHSSCSRSCVSSKDESIAIRLLHHVLRLVLPHGEGIALLRWHVVHLLDVLQAVLADVQQLSVMQQLARQHEVDHHPCGRHDLPEVLVELRPIYAEALKEAARGILRPGLVKADDVADVLHQELLAEELVRLLALQTL